MHRRSVLLFAVLAALASCESPEVALPEDGRDDAFAAGGKADGGLSAAQIAGVLQVANTATLEALDDDAALDRRAAEGIVARRVSVGPYEALAQLDAVPWVGPSALAKLAAYAETLGPPGSGPACLLISEYIEGSHAYNKAIEIYNCGSESLPLAEYAICLVRNDDTDCTLTAAFADVALPPGGVWTACRSMRPHFNDPYPQLVAACDEELGSVMINSGDDRVVLLHAPNGEDSIEDAAVMDSLGRITFRPTWSPWQNVGLRRCTAERNLGTIFFDEADWFTEHHHQHYEHLGVAPSFECD